PIESFSIRTDNARTPPGNSRDESKRRLFSKSVGPSFTLRLYPKPPETAACSPAAGTPTALYHEPGEKGMVTIPWDLSKLSCIIDGVQCVHSRPHPREAFSVRAHTSFWTRHFSPRPSPWRISSGCCWC